jgi:hypothetical protein
MIKEAVEAGLYKSSDGITCPRLQILTIQQILDGKQPEYPLHRRDATFKKAPRRGPAAESLTLPLGIDSAQCAKGMPLNLSRNLGVEVYGLHPVFSGPILALGFSRRGNADP